MCVTVEFETAVSLHIFAFAFAGWHVDQDKREVSEAVQLVDRPGRSTGGPSICALVKDWRGPSMQKPPPEKGEGAGKEAYRTNTTLNSLDDAILIYIYIYIQHLYFTIHTYAEIPQERPSETVSVASLPSVPG